MTFHTQTASQTAAEYSESYSCFQWTTGTEIVLFSPDRRVYLASTDLQPCNFCEHRALVGKLRGQGEKKKGGKDRTDRAKLEKQNHEKSTHVRNL